MVDSQDKWLRWLLDVRFGGDADVRAEYLTEFLYPVRDTVLDRAGLRPGDSLLDVGTGDGLIAFGALDRSGPDGRVIFSDISLDLLDHCRRAAAAEKLIDRCGFVQASADSLTGVADESVDVVTTRSVLIYVKDKAAALAEFYRVLKPGGRASLFEPVNRLMGHCDPSLFFGYPVGPVTPLAAKVSALYDSIQPPDTDPMTDFDDRDLVRHAERAGFPDVQLELRLTVRSVKPPMAWELFLRTSGNPLIPPVGDAIDQVLSPGEAAEFTAHLRPLVESGTGQQRDAFAYLTAAKAASA